MKTVKEISQLSGISVRTLHYYDEIALLKPTEKSDAGYRLYDDQALETLQQILFFREFDIPLREIKAIMNSPDFDRNQTLQMQRKMLMAKKDRLHRLIVSIDNILKGENQMNFEVFNKTEIEELCQSTLDRMPEIMKQSIMQEFGGIEQWRKHYVARCSKEDMQRGYQKMVEWYGDKDGALKAMHNPPSKEVGATFGKRVEALEHKLNAQKRFPPDSLDVKQIVGEYGFVMKHFLQVQHEAGIMMSVAANYRDERAKAIVDQKYGEGAADFFACAIEAFYKGESSS